MQDARRWIARLLVFAFALRALVPVGFMPDLIAAQNGNFSVVICTVHGMVSIAVDDTGKVVPEKTDAKVSQQCVFSVLATLSLPAFDAGLKLSAQHVVLNITPLRSVERPPARAGPQLGSRGPPILS